MIGGITAMIVGIGMIGVKTEMIVEEMEMIVMATDKDTIVSNRETCKEVVGIPISKKNNGDNGNITIGREDFKDKDAMQDFVTTKDIGIVCVRIVCVCKMRDITIA